MNELSEIFREMSRIVIEQGTVMDRIEENILVARYKVITAQKEVHITMERDTSPKANACIVCLVQSILVCIVILMIKHSN